MSGPMLKQALIIQSRYWPFNIENVITKCFCRVAFIKLSFDFRYDDVNHWYTCIMKSICIIYINYNECTETPTENICYTPYFFCVCRVNHSHPTVWSNPWNGSLQWRHNGCDGVSNHHPYDCLLNRLFRRRSKKTSKLHVTGLCVGNSPVTDEFPAQRASNAENVSIWWRHHDEL